MTNQEALVKITQTIAFDVPFDAITEQLDDAQTATVTLPWETAMELAEGLDRALNRVANSVHQHVYDGPDQLSTSEFMDEWDAAPVEAVEETTESLSAAQILARMQLQAEAAERVEPNPGTHDGRHPGTGIGAGQIRPRQQRRGAS